MPKKKTKLKLKKSKISTKKIPAVVEKINPQNSRDVFGQLNELAHAGTEQAIKELKKFIDEEQNNELRGYAECALGEAEFNFYIPRSEQEEKDFWLAKMIHKRQDRFFKQQGKFDSAEMELQKLDLDRKVHQKIMKSLTDENQKKEWKYNFSEDYYMMVKNRYERIKDELDYEARWLEQAQKMIKSKKYKNIAVNDDVLFSIVSDVDEIDFWEDGCGGPTDLEWDRQFDADLEKDKVNFNSDDLPDELMPF